MGYAKYVGRVGALAVSLGIGTAVVFMPSVAVAQDGDSGSSATGTSSSSTTGPNQTDSTDSTSAPGSVGQQPAATQPGSIVGSSPEARLDTTAAPDAQTPAVAEDFDDAKDAKDAKGNDSKTDDPDGHQPPVAKSDTDTVVASTPAVAHRAVVVESPVPRAQHTPSGAAFTAPQPPVESFTAAVELDASSTALVTEETSPVTAFQVTSMQAPPPPVSFVTGLVSGLLAWVGLGPSLSTVDTVPVEPPALWGLLAWVTREIQRTFFNHTPTTAYNPVDNSQLFGGAITGDLVADDADDDPLTFTVTEAPQNGAVIVHPDGTFTYTPSDDFAATGGDDEFTVEIADQGFHLHGLSGLLNLVTFGLFGDAGHTRTVKVPVTLEPINTVIETIDVDGRAFGVALNPDGSRAYAPNAADDTVSVIDTATNTVIGAPIGVGETPVDVALSPDGTRAYVTNSDDDTVSVIDTATNTVIETVSVGLRPQRVVVTPDGAYAYVTNFSDGTVSVIDTADNTVVDTVEVGNVPRGVAVSPDGTRVYTADSFDGTVSVIDTADNTVVATIPVGNSPFDVAVSPDGTRLYVINTGDSTVSVFDTESHTAIGGPISVGLGSQRIAISPDGSRAYVTNQADNTVSVIDTDAGVVVDTIGVGGAPFAITISPDGTRAYVSSVNSATVSVLRL